MFKSLVVKCVFGVAQLCCMLLNKHAYNLLIKLFFNIMNEKLKEKSKKEIFDCAIVLRQEESSEVCLKFQCMSIDEAIQKLSNCSISGKVVSFIFGDFHNKRV